MKTDNYPETLRLKDLQEGTAFRASFDIVQQPKDPNFYVAKLDTNVAIGRVIVPKGGVNEETEVKVQWFQDGLVEKPKKKVSKAKKKG